jgi:selenocysteine-specific elongation factor
MLVVGTAGHIDHGKSSVVRRLTGTDPDRLPEEKERGMTIDLGFAFYRTSGGDEIAFVDVPGHERFVKNMIAGAGGIDVVMLVVAADDGWMPQSQEHFQIIRLLNVRHGLIVINKIDLSTPEWVTLLQEELRAKVNNSILDGAPIVPISAQTGDGFPELKSYLDQLPSMVKRKQDIGKPRLYVDRSFVRPGIGGVVTGTLRGGSLSVGQSVSVWPSGAIGKIRSLQSTNQDVSVATPGQRTAVAVTGADKDLLIRGGVISDRTDVSYFKDHPVLAVSVQMLAESPVALEDRRRVFLMVGTTEMEGELRLFQTNALRAGQSGIAFIRPDEPMLTHAGDHFILRLPTPMVTLGGGTVLDHLPQFPRRRELETYAWLAARTSDNLDDWIISELKKLLFALPTKILEYAEFDSRQVVLRCSELRDQQCIAQFGEYYFYPEAVAAAKVPVIRAVGQILADQPHLKGAFIEQIARAAETPTDRAALLVEYLVSTGELKRAGELISLLSKSVELKGVIKEAHDQIVSALKAAPYTPPALSEFTSRGKVFQQAIAFLIEQGSVHKAGADFLFSVAVWEEFVSFIRQRLTAHPSLSIGDLKERFGVTRKWAVPILEETDRLGLTERKGDFRVKGPKFNA